MRIGLCAAALAILVSSSSLIAQTQDRAIGTWTLNLAKLKYAPRPTAPEPDDQVRGGRQGVRLTTRGEDSEGRPIRLEYVTNYDGENWPVTGAPDYDTVVLRVIDASTLEIIRKRIGLVVQTVRRVVSKDGTALTTVTTGVDGAGRHVKDVAVFDVSSPEDISQQREGLMDITTILIQALSGLVGGNVAGLLNKAKSLGPTLNSILGAVGGVAGGQLLGGQVGGLLGNGTAGTAGASAIMGLLVPLIGGFFKKS